MGQMTRHPASWTDTAPAKFSATREMPASPQQVWDALCDHKSWTTWFPLLQSCEPTGGTGIGSTRTVKAGGSVVDEEFIVWDEPSSWGFSVVSSTGLLARVATALNERVDIEELAPDQVRVTYLMAFEPASWAGPLFKLAGIPLTKNIERALAGLDDYLTTNR